MTDLSRLVPNLPPEQEAIRAKCFHPSGTFMEFSKEEVEQSIPSRFEQIVARHSDRIAVKTRNCALTYGALNRAANRFADAIASKRRDEERPVALLLGHDATMIAGILGVFKTGKICVPLDPGFHEARTHYLLRNSEAGLVVTDSKNLPLACRSAPDPVQVINIDDINPGSFSSSPGLLISPERPSYILYTSGSTGQPKGVVQNHRTLLHDVRAYTNSFHICADDRLTLFASLSGGEGMKNALSGLLNGATVCQRDIKREGFADLAGWLIDEEITIWVSTPAIFRSFTATLGGEEKFPRLRLVRLGSGSVRKRDVELYKKHVPPQCVFLNWLSSTEIGNFAHYFIDKKTEIQGDRVPAGFGFADKQLLLLDDNGQETGFDQIGEIAVKSRYLSPGYWRRDDLTRAKFRPDPNAGDLCTYLTGDLGRMLPDGCLYHLGRKDLQVKIRGYRIEIGEVESALEAIEQVKEAAVVKREIAGSGEDILVAYVVPERNPAPAVASLRDALGEKLPSYMQPSRFIFLDALPLAPNGKIDRDALPPSPVSRPDIGAPFVPPETLIEKTLAQIWADVLELDCVGIRDNFFELGGHSLAAAHVVSHVLSRFQLQISVESLLQFPTVTELAAVIAERRAKQPGDRPERGGSTEAPALAPVSRDKQVPLSFSQQRLWFLHQFEPHSAVYNEPKAFRLSGSLDITAMRAAIEAIVGRHKILRSVYSAVDGSPAQLVLEKWSVELEQIDLVERLEPQRAKKLDQVLKEITHRAFDLSRDLMLRTALIRLAHDEHVLLLVTHHIASDGWSSSILFRELSALYGAFSQGHPSPLTDLPIQYQDYAIRQRNQFKGEYLDKELSYWRKQLENISPLELPSDRSRPAVQSHRGRKKRFTLPIELAGGLKSLSRQESVTFFMTLLAAFQILLHRYSGREDIAVGSPVAGRGQLEIEGLIGFFVNTLVLRNDLSGDPTFRELLRRVKRNALAAYSHQDLPFEKLVEALHPERDLSRNPLFQVALQLRNYPDASVKLANLTVEEIDFDSGIAKFDLSLGMRDRAAGLEGTLEYSEDLFADSTISRMVGHFHKLLQEIRSNPDRRISELRILTDSERDRLLVEWNDTQTDDPGNKCVHELFEAQAELAPDAVAVVCAGEQLTYRELNSRANQLARHLRKLGVGPEVAVGICLERSMEMVVGLLGILKAGGAYVPLDPALPKERVKFIIEDTRAPVLLTQHRLAGLIEDKRSDHGIEDGHPPSSIRSPEPQARVSKAHGRSLDPRIKVLCLDADWAVISRESEENPVNQAMPENMAYVIYTSGSTGKPKGVSIEHRQIVNYVRGIVDRCNLEAQARFAMVQPLAVDSSQTVIFPSLISGGCLHVIPEDEAADPQALSRYVSRFTIDVLKIAPSHLAALQNSPHPERLLPRRRLIVGGEASRWDWMEKIQSMAGNCAVFNHYGPTETTVGVLTYHVPENATDPGSSTVPLGRPLPNTQVYILDSNLRPVPIGVPGELHFAGRCLARGYLDRPEATAEKFVPNPFSNEPGARLYKTGDLGRYLSDGNIEFLGRTDHQVKIRGFRIEPGEIESALAQHPAVREAVVAAREDVREEPDMAENRKSKTSSELGRSARNLKSNKRLVAYVVPHRDLSPSASELRSYLKEKLPDHMVPSAFVLLDALPRTPHGKLDLRALPEPDRSRSEVEENFVAPRTPVEELLIKIWAEVLSLETVGIHDNFFDLGGHSLLATQVISRLREAFQVEPPLRSLFESPTVAALAERIETLLWTGEKHQPARGTESGEREEIEL